MSWEIYDKNAFLDYFGSTYNLVPLSKKGLPGVNTFINNRFADKKLIKQMIKELEGEEDFKWLLNILRRATPPIRLCDGTEPWLRKMYPNEDWLEPE